MDLEVMRVYMTFAAMCLAAFEQNPEITQATEIMIMIKEPEVYYYKYIWWLYTTVVYVRLLLTLISWLHASCKL